MLCVLQLLFPVLGMDQEASPRGLRDSDSMITINVFDEVVTPTAAAKAMRAVARASNAGSFALPLLALPSLCVVQCR